MLFSSSSFLFMFLPIVCLGYLLIGSRFRNGFLLLASLLFYGWGEPRYVAVMLAVILFNYMAGIGMTRYVCFAKWILGIDVAANLGILIFFKYTNFLIENWNVVTADKILPLHVVMPIGISFFIFQALSYAFDVYRGEVHCQKDLSKLALYVALFPQLVAGPIVKYQDIAESLERRSTRAEDIIYGVQRFIIGLSKKVLIANTMGSVADSVYGTGTAHITWEIAWLGAIAYSLQLFFDFSGYSDMAIGLGRIFGFRFRENFNYPYIATSMTDFWRRWHISLGIWFREYVYIPLGGSRYGTSRTAWNLLIVFFAIGIWHGASWNFVVWGLWNGIFIALEKRWPCFRFQSAVGHGYVILVFLFGLVFFWVENLQMAIEYIAVMFGFRQGLPLYGWEYYVTPKHLLVGGAAMIFCVPWNWDALKQHRIFSWCYDVCLLCFLALSVIWVAASTYNPFIYFRF